MDIEISKMSESEKSIMQIIWKAGRPVTSNAIMELCKEEKQWKITTVLTFLSRLAEKGMISYEKKGKTNYYHANITAKQYARLEAKKYLDAKYNGSIRSFVATLYNGEDMPEEDIKQLREWLDERG